MDTWVTTYAVHLTDADIGRLVKIHLTLIGTGNREVLHGVLVTTGPSPTQPQRRKLTLLVKDKGRPRAMALTLYNGDTIEVQRPTKENDQ